MLAANPAPDARVLDVATGPGYLAMGFARWCRDVVAVDLTAAPLERARRVCDERGISNVRFQVADAQNLPFEAGSFDVVACRFAFHHFEDPGTVLAQMACVCRANGVVVIEDVVASEHEARAAYQNRIELLRDPSHARALSLGELLALCTRAGLEVAAVYTDTIVQYVSRWLSNAQTPPERAEQVRSLIEEDGQKDLSGMQPCRQDGDLLFAQHTAAVVGRKLANVRS